MAGTKPDSNFHINRIGIRVPPFWPEKPAMWFAQLEGQFALSNITQDKTKYYYVISQLDNKYTAEVEDVITNPPPTGRYDRIKAELIRCLSHSEQQCIRQLLMHEEMCDRRPTAFLRHLRTLAGPSVPSDFLHTTAKLAGQVAALSTRPSCPRSPSQTQHTILHLFKQPPSSPVLPVVSLSPHWLHSLRCSHTLAALYDSWCSAYVRVVVGRYMGRLVSRLWSYHSLCT
jgi:hypothetical protein